MNRRFKRNNEVVTRAIAGEVVIVPVCGGRGDLETIYRLDEVGAFIWEELADEKDAEQLASAVAANFSVDVETAAKDLPPFLADLEKAGLLGQA